MRFGSSGCLSGLEKSNKRLFNASRAVANFMLAKLLLMIKWVGFVDEGVAICLGGIACNLDIACSVTCRKSLHEHVVLRTLQAWLVDWYIAEAGTRS